MKANYYTKRGNLSAREKKLIRRINSAIGKNPSLESEIEPANTLDELEALYEKHCTEPAEIISETAPETPDETVGSYADKIDLSAEGSHEPAEQVIDPFNESEPNVRDYVLKEDFQKDNPNAQQPTGQTNFGEPTTFKDSFEIPEDISSDQSSHQSGGNNSSWSNGQQNGKPKKEEPYNPSFNSMSNATKNRKTKRMAKSIVNVFCFLLKEGVPKWATRDITPDALAAAAKNNQINLDVILTFDSQTKVAVTDYFKIMCEEAKQLGEIPPQLQEELIEDLYEVLLEKGITPTPAQSLLLTMGEILLMVGIKTYGFRLQIGAVMNVVKVEEAAPMRKQRPTPRRETPPQEEEKQPEPPTEPVAETTRAVAKRDEKDLEQELEEFAIGDARLDTKE